MIMNAVLRALGYIYNSLNVNVCVCVCWGVGKRGR